MEYMKGANNVVETDQGRREIVFERIFDAPRELVFNVWTEPQHVRNWWGPNGFKISTTKMDVRPGGVWEFTMHGPDGVDYLNRVVYLVVAKPNLLVYQQGDRKDDDGQFKVTVTFEQQEERTKLTMQMLFRSVEARNFAIQNFGAVEGGNQTLDRLTSYLELQSK